MRACIASSARDFNSQPSSDTSGAVKASEMIIALEKKVSLRNRRTPGAHGPWCAKKPPAADSRPGPAATALALMAMLIVDFIKKMVPRQCQPATGRAGCNWVGIGRTKLGL